MSLSSLRTCHGRAELGRDAAQRVAALDLVGRRGRRGCGGGPRRLPGRHSRRVVARLDLGRDQGARAARRPSPPLRPPGLAVAAAGVAWRRPRRRPPCRPVRPAPATARATRIAAKATRHQREQGGLARGARSAVRRRDATASRPWSRTSGAVRTISRPAEPETRLGRVVVGRADQVAVTGRDLDRWRSRRGRRRGTAGAACRPPGRPAGATAVQRCSRAGVADRQRPSSARRYGQTTATAGRGRRGGGRPSGALVSTMGPSRIPAPMRRIGPPEWFPLETQKSRRRPIFPKGCPLSIFGAGELDFRVRDGNGYGLSARVTGICCVWTWSAAAARGSVDPAGAGRDLRSRG